jgi:hypothetical protein
MNLRTQSAFIAMGIASVAGSARAQVEPIRLTYNAPAACSSEGAFLQEVSARTARARRAVRNERARAFAVTVVLEESKIRGHLEITGVDGSISTREVTGDTCAEVVSALALTTALSIDPLASVAPASGTEVPGASEDAGLPRDQLATTAAQASNPTVNPQGAEAPAEPNQAPISQASDRGGASSAASTTRGSTERPHWAVGGGALVLAGLAPGLAVAGELFGAVDAKATGVLAPSFRLSLEWAGASAQFQPQPLGADLIWLLARFETCLLRFSGSSEFFASICAALQGGVLHSSGASSGLQVNSDVYKPWVAPEALGRLTLALSPRWFIDGAAGIIVPLIRYHFYYFEGGNPSASVYDIPPVGATLAMDVGYGFP